MRLNKDFFLQDTIIVSQKLIGKKIIVNVDKQEFSGIITETEAYMVGDSACHGYRGKTARNEAIFEEGGIAYVYFIYGMYYCLNFVTEKKDYYSAVLIRGIDLLTPQKKLLDGPGKICKYLGINRSHDKIDIVKGNFIQLYDIGFNPLFESLPRVGITKNADKLWRFYMNKNYRNDLSVLNKY
jgi:DNA-3-methyladenine glycosylase